MYLGRMALKSNQHCCCDTLIEKSEELSTKKYAGFPLPFRLLGAVALIPFPKLQTDFRQIVSPSDDSLKERAEKCKNLFVDALARPLDSNSYASKGGEDALLSSIVESFLLGSTTRRRENGRGERLSIFLDLAMHDMDRSSGRY